MKNKKSNQKKQEKMTDESKEAQLSSDFKNAFIVN